MKFIKISMILMCLILFTAEYSAGSEMDKEEAQSVFIKAGFSYRDGNYTQAAEQYQQMADGGWESDALYFNLANSYAKLGQQGRAVLSYERALLLSPRDGDIRANLRFVRQKIKGTPASIPENVLQRMWKEHLQFYTIDEMVLIVTGLVFIILILVICAVYFRNERAKILISIAGAAFFLIVFSVGLLLKSANLKNSGIALETAEVLFEPREGATAHYKIFEGQSITLLRQEGLWYKIQRDDHKAGWVPVNKVEKLLKGF